MDSGREYDACKKNKGNRLKFTVQSFKINCSVHIQPTITFLAFDAAQKSHYPPGIPTMLVTSKNVLFPSHNHLLTTRY